MISFFKGKSKNYILFSILLAFFPISFIAGNLIINLNTVLIIIFSIIILKRDLFKINFYLLDKLILLLFFFIIFTGIFNDIFFILTNAYPETFQTIKKSILFLKYLLLYIAIRCIVEKKLVNLNFFFMSCLLCSSFVCFDIFYQYFFGKDIFGYEILFSRKLSGPFGDELIAGGYLARFSIFAFFLVPVIFINNYRKYVKFIIPILLIIFFTGIILSGNRMPLIMFIFTLFLITIFIKEIRKYFLVFISTIIIIFTLTFKFNSEVKDNFFSFYNNVSSMIVLASNLKFNEEKSPQYFKEFVSFYETWKLNKYIGGGIKNFRYYCHVRPNIDKSSETVCNMHPHNYYLEILTELGLIGASLVLIIFSQILFFTFYKKYFSKSQLKNDNTITPFIFLFISEIFPMKSTGSFFTTNNATYLFLIIAILIGLSNLNNSIENKKFNYKFKK